MKPHHRLIAYLAVLVTAALVSPAAALNWDIDVPYDGGLAGFDASMALNGGVAQIAHTAGGYVLLTTKQVGYWNNDPVGICGYGGGWCSTAASPTALQGVAYIDAAGATNDLKYAYKSGATWYKETIDNVGDIPDYVSLAYDSGGVACIAYCGQRLDGTRVIKFARRSGGAWSSEEVAVVGDATGPSLALDSLQRPWISFTDTATGTARLAHKAVTWTVETVDGSLAAPAQWYTSVRLGSGDVPSVSYFGEATASAIYLKYAKKSGAIWVAERITLLPVSSIQYCSLALGSGGTPSIAYFDSSAGSPAFARKLAGSWSTEAIDEGPLSGYKPSLVLDASGAPLVAYVDFYYGYLRYASTRPDSLPSVKQYPDGEIVSLDGVVTSTSDTDVPHALYVQNPGRSSGVQLSFGAAAPPTMARGTGVHVDGAMGTLNGERCVMSPSLTIVTSPGVPAPLIMQSSAVGGGDDNYQAGPPASGQKGIQGGKGLSNIGLLVRMAGTITATGSGYLYVDDGCGVSDGTLTNGQPNTGVRVICSPGGYQTGDCLSVTGLSSCFITPSGELARQIVPRIGDLVRLSP